MIDFPDDWTPEQFAVFSRVYDFLICNQCGVSHPQAVAISSRHWQTICHNAAYVAAEMIECETLNVLDNETGELIAASPCIGVLH